MRFNLVVASKGDKLVCLDRLFSSLFEQREKVKIRIFFVDQNRDNRNSGLVDKWGKHFDIVSISDLGVGLSRARNVGLSALYSSDFSFDDVVLFPDDDCSFCENFFSVASLHLSDMSLDGVYYRVFDIEDFDSELSYTAKLNIDSLSLVSVFASVTSINFIHKLSDRFMFDEDFGLGAEFNSSEEILYVSHLLRKGLRFKFLDDVKIFHPRLDASGSIEGLYKKIWFNSVGHGALAGKLWKLGSPRASLYLLLIGPIGRILASSLVFDGRGAKIGFIYFIRRWYGFLKLVFG